MRELLLETSFSFSNSRNLRYDKKHTNENLKNVFERLELSGSKTISIELSPTNNSSVTEKLNGIGRTFCSVSWHIQKESSLENLQHLPAFKLSKELLNCGNTVLLHITSRSLHENQALTVLNYAKQIGIRNLLLLQGDIRNNVNKKKYFKYAIDLVKFTRKNYGNYFSIGVAGYPSGHPKSKTLEDDLEYLKSKINAGADFIISQAVFDYTIFDKFQKRCRTVGIKVPILPGIFAFTSRKSLLKMSLYCDIIVPEDVRNVVEQNKNNSLSVYNYGIFYTTELIKQFLLVKNDPILDVHMFTLNNMFAVYEICRRLGFCKMIVEKPLEYSQNDYCKILINVNRKYNKNN